MFTSTNFFPPYISCPFCRFSIFVFLALSFLYSFTKMKVYTVSRWENKWSKVKTLQDKPRSRWPGFFNKLCEKCYRKSCKYMHNNSTRLQGKFRAQRCGDMWPTKVGKPWKEKRQCTLHAGMASEEFANFIPKDDRPANSRDANPLVTIWIIVDETTYKDPAPKTLD